MKISIYQFDIQWLNASSNISLIRNKLESIDNDVDLMVLPEMYLSGFCMNTSLSAIRENSKEINELRELSIKYNIALMGSLAIKEEGKYYNRVLLISGNGIVGRYDKQYLYSPSGENAAFDSKYDTNLIHFNGWSILPQVCYDLRFPENVRQLPAPDLLVYMANWPTPRIHHWDTLIKARAIENQCFTIGCNRIGKDGNDWEYPGHSVVIMPDGSILNEDQNSKRGMYTLNLSIVSEYRAKYRFLEDKKG